MCYRQYKLDQLGTSLDIWAPLELAHVPRRLKRESFFFFFFWGGGGGG